MNDLVSSGYTHSDIGTLPDDWSVRPLSEIVSVMTNGFVGTATSAYVENDDGVTYIQGFNVEPNGFNLTNIRKVSQDFHKSHTKSCLRTGDVLTIQTGEIGVSTVVPEYLSGSNCHALIISRFIKNRAHPAYYCQYFNSKIGMNAFKEIETGTTMKHLNVGDMLQLLVPVPPIAEQQAIADTLLDMDTLISSLDQLIAKKRDIQQAAMQQLLTGQRRLPGFSGARSRHALRDLVSTPVTDGPHETPRFVENGIPFLSVNNIANNRIDFRDLRFISREDHRIYSKKCRPQRNDLLLGKAASVGKVALIETDIELNIWSPIALIRMSDAHDPRYFYYAFRSKEIGRQIEVLTNSSSQGNIGMGDIERLIFSVPDLAEQTAIATILSDMDTELAVLEARRDKARQLKQGMMQELLTGRIRLV